MNQTEIALLELAGKAVDYKCLSRFQRMCRDVSWHGFLVGTAIAIAICSLAEIVAWIQHAPINAGTIFIIGIFVSTAFVKNFSALLVTVDSIIGYYVLFGQWVSGRWGTPSYNIALFIFSLLAFSAFYFVRIGQNRKPGKNKAVAQAVIKIAAPESTLDIERLPSCN